MIIDASVAFKWFVAERGSDDAHALLRAQHELCAPDLILAEVAGALARAVQAGAIDAGDAETAVGRLSSLFAELAPAGDLIEAAFALALALKRPVASCLYLALAERRDDVLLTADRAMLKAVAGSRLERRVRAL